VAGLLALMLLTDARRAARTGPDGELIPLTKQDRRLWNQAQISEGIALLTAALARGSIGVYQLQAAIAAVHDEAPRRKTPTGRRSWRLYDLLKRMSDNPMVMLNHAIAVAMVHGPPAGLNCWMRSTRMGGYAAIIAWMRCAPICWRCRATARPPSCTTGWPPAGPPACPNGTIY
jgi:predicted RNA polymerase sigma factor